MFKISLLLKNIFETYIGLVSILGGLGLGWNRVFEGLAANVLPSVTRAVYDTTKKYYEELVTEWEEASRGVLYSFLTIALRKWC